MSKFTQRYEELNLMQYQDLDAHQLIFHNPDAEELRQSLQVTGQSLRNPYIELYHWVKGEIYDIEAMRQAVNARNQV